MVSYAYLVFSQPPASGYVNTETILHFCSLKNGEECSRSTYLQRVSLFCFFLFVFFFMCCNSLWTIFAVPPRFVQAPETYHLGYETWDTTLTCNIFAFPPPKIQWTRSFRPLPIDRHAVVGKDLVIKETRKEDRGPFMCRGENHLGHVYALIVLVVKPVSKWIIKKCRKCKKPAVNLK